MTAETTMPIEMRPADRTVVLIDGASAAALGRSVGWSVDFKKLRDFVAKKSHLIHARYFSLVAANDDAGDREIHDSFRGLLDFLSYNGFVVETRQVKLKSEGGGPPRLRGSMSVNLALRMVNDAAVKADHILLFAGDGALAPAVSDAQRLGAKVTVVGSKDGDFMSDALRRQADMFVEMDGLKDTIGRPPRSS